jgi:hypothetical protein
MIRSTVKSQRLVAVFLLGMVLFNYPVMALFNSAAETFGIPLLYAYIFLAWTLLIGLLVLIIERSV